MSEKFNIAREKDNFPHQTFMSWFRENYRKHLFIDVSFYPFANNIQRLSDFITSKDISSWKSETPVIISAQTGIGKTHFVLEDLLRQALSTKNEKDVMLILVNRVALSRQTKIELARNLKSLIGNEQYEHALQDYYTTKGIDELFIDFGVVTLCTYHQCYKKQLLQIKRFKYIICDECHFFTSDATFNPETDLMLKDIVKNGSNSVRIYMSATPEVALEPIIKFEYEVKREPIDDLISKSGEYKKCIDVEHRLKVNNAPPKFIFQGAYGCSYQISLPEDIDKVIEEEESNLKISFKFYYIPRDYNYLNFQATYSKVEELIPYIEKSKSKWLIFINDNKRAKEFQKKLREKNISSEFISRESISSDNSSREEYDYLIEEETFRPKILISTSIIDNGINISNKDITKDCDKVLNIAVEETNRTQFLQMIGRIRASSEPINLYIRDYSLADIKDVVKKDVSTLAKVLWNDFLDMENRQNNFDKKLFRYVNDNTNQFSTYNVCSVYQLISHIAHLLKIIRNNEPDFYIELNGKDDNIREKVYLNYVEGENYCWSKIWSRAVVDIIESTEGAKKRKKLALEELERSVTEDRFNSTITDTFIKFIFSDLLLKFIDAKIEEDFNIILNMMDAKNTSYYKTMCFRVKNKQQGSALSIEARLKILKQLMIEDQVHFGNIFKSSLASFKSEYEESERYKDFSCWLTDDKETTPIESQFKWLQRFDLRDKINFEIERNIENINSLEEYIRNHYVTAEDFEENKRGATRNKCEHSFLKKTAILKDSPEANELTKKFFDGKSLTDMLDRKWSIGNHFYEFKSIIDNKDNHTYYLFVQCPKE